MTANWYIWDTATALATAEAALNYINSDDKFPIPSYNGKTGEIDLGAHTSKWASEVTKFTNGKCGFKKIPDSRLDAMGVSEEERGLFLTTFNPTIEPRDPSWVIIGEDPT